MGGTWRCEGGTSGDDRIVGWGKERQDGGSKGMGRTSVGQVSDRVLATVVLAVRLISTPLVVSFLRLA